MTDFLSMNNMPIGTSGITNSFAGLNKMPAGQNFGNENDFASFYQNAMNDTGNFDNSNVISGQVNANFYNGTAINGADNEIISNLRSVVNNENINASAVDGSPEKAFQSFSNAVSDGLNHLNATEKTSEDYTKRFAAGEDIDIHTVMIASQKANLSMGLALQLRNKLVQAYQEISRISV